MAGTAKLSWRKSSFSGNNGGDCVEVAGHGRVILVRDSKQRGRGQVQRFTADEWRAFIGGIRPGRL